jgi:Mg-chelatase subunit ChlD
MNPDSPIDPRSALESSLTALLLGELPHEEAAALHQKLAQDAELAKLYERLKHTINLVRETVASPAVQIAGQPTPLKLSDQRRQKLLQHFKTVAPKEFVRPRRRPMPWLVPVGIAAGLVVIISGLLLPASSKSKSRGQSLGFHTFSLSEQADSAAPAPALEKSFGLALGGNRNRRMEPPALKGESRVTGLPATPPAEVPVPQAQPAGNAIVLPQSGELADATTMPPLAEGVRPLSASAASSRVFYDDSLSRRGGQAGGGGFGGFSGKAITADAVEGRENKPAAPDSLAGKPEWFAALDAEKNRQQGEAKDSAFKSRYAYGVPPAAANDIVVSPPPGAVPPPVAMDVAPQATPVAATPSRPQEIAVEKAVRLNPDAVVLREELVEARPAARRGIAPSDTDKLSTDQAGLVPGMQPPEANLKAKLAETTQDDRKALGFNWNLGNSPPINRRITAPAGAPPSDHFGKSDGAFDFSVAAPGNETLNYRLRSDANAQPGLANSESEKVPALGDLPVLGRLFQSTTGDAGAGNKADLGTLTPPQVATLNARYGIASLERTYPNSATIGNGYFSTDPENCRDVPIAPAKAADISQVVSSLDAPKEPGRQETVGYFNLKNADPSDVQALQELLRSKTVARQENDLAKRSPIVLPTPRGEPSLALKDGDSKEVQLFARAYAPGSAPATHGDTKKQEAEDLSKQSESRITLQGITAPAKPAASAPIPQPEVQTAENAFSTFSLNVSDVAFKLAAASLEKGVMPEPATVRSEEFINAFDYRDPEPPPGVPVAFAWERAQYPFAQNRDLLRFSIKTAAQGRQPGRPLNLVLLLDNSGSMERADRVRIIHEALRVLAEQLQPQDKLSVVTFARTPRLFADGAPGSDAGAIAMALTELTPQGGTNLEDAMNLAYQTALRHYLANGINRVVLLTDGAANLGNVDPEALKQKVEANRKQGIALDCFGIGWEGYNDDLLEVLSRNGDGRYAFLNTPEEVGDEFAAKLAGALQVAASDVKVQVEFNPGRVTAYRQIGYAKHQLTKEQFRDNTVNAAQIGAAEAGNALYAVEVNPNGAGPLCTVRVRFRIPGTADYREHAWDVPFNGNAVALEQATPAMRLAATGSAFSEWLVSSPYAGEVTPDRLLGYLSGVPEIYGADARPKKLEWMIRQAKSITGK